MDKSEKFWDRISRQWDAGGNQLDETSSNLVAKTKQYLQPEDIVMDFGCGTGTITLELASSVAEIYGSDISSGMIDVAARLAKERDISNAKFIKANLLDDELENVSFSVIIAFSIIHLLENPAEIFRRMGKLLPDNGTLICATPCLGETRTIFGLVLSILSKVKLVPRIQKLSISEIEELVRGHGFDIVETEILDTSPVFYFIAARKV